MARAASAEPPRVTFPGGAQASVLVAAPGDDAEEVSSRLRLPDHAGVLVLNGGTRPLGRDVRDRVRSALRAAADVVAGQALVAVTGGTDAGVFALFGAALDRRRPTVGVAPQSTVSHDPGSAGDDTRVALEPHHTHFVLVRDGGWGVETPLMLRLAAVLGRHVPSVAVLAGGGPGARDEVRGHLRAGRPVVVVGGTGRFADELAAAVAQAGGRDGAGRDGPDLDLDDMASSPLLEILPSDRPASDLGPVLRRLVRSEQAR